LIILLHRGTVGEWDFDILANSFDVDNLLEWGFDEKELDLSLWGMPAQGDAEPQFDRAEELREIWGVQLGDLWQLGEHRLACGDCTDAAVVARVMGREKAAMVFTDPPYGMRLDADFSGMVCLGVGNKYENVVGDHEDYDPMHLFRDFGYCREIFLWGADYYAEKIPKRNDGSWVVWDKMGGGNGVNDDYDKMFGSNFELCWSKEKHKRALCRVLWKGIFGLSKEDTKRRVHPTQKPTELAEWFLSRFSVENAIVADPFLGSGTTIIACENLKRKCRAIEISPQYVSVAIQRFADAFPGLEIKKISP
jgi:DNA modification methylase